LDINKAIVSNIRSNITTKDKNRHALLLDMSNMTKNKVLLTGIDPKLIDSSLVNTTGWDASRVQAAAQDAIKRLMDLGYEVQTCLVDFGETAESVVSDTLSREKFDCIMIGAGTRIPQHTLLFEKIINTIHQKAPPSSKICFNTNPSDTVEAVLRCM
jgi:hypothetical protein